jgi:biotin/methionine sulfoxide reductase
MTEAISRYPSLSHWGAYTALVRDGRVEGGEPVAPDPAPAPPIHPIPDMVH